MNIPSSWEVIKFYEINEFKSATINPDNFSFEKFDLYSVPIFPLGKPENLIGKEIGSTKQLVEPDDVLISKINPRINRVWKVAEKKSLRQIASSEWIVFRNKHLESRYFLYYFRSPLFREKLCSDVTGVGGSLTRAQPKRVAEFLLPVAPLAEQRRIADKLDTTLAHVDALNDRLARITPLLKRLRQSVLAAATSGRLTEDISNLFGKEKNNFWELKSVDSIADVIDPHPSHRTPPEVLGGVPYVSIGDIDEQGNIDFEKSRKVSPVVLEEHKSRYLIENGDFIFGKIGTIGKPTKIPINIEYTISANVILIKPKKELVNPDYLRYFFSSINFLEDIAKKSVATSQAAFGIKKMRSLQIKIPTLEEQTEIVRRVEILFAFADRLEARLQSAQTAAERLTPALLAKAFRGELVPQDPNDEPAAELLRRLREARVAAPLQKKTRVLKARG